ncbi:uncharacterized protein EI90DRAFT_1763549 [Cantharellus anzutake]|uniref:uncharacterized protein n=1 Tax=Cantharellus anzutake TaxID=1750568 RepID=UPI0019075166|nr:uncharacterized protein EI90DRAFT_1763549 [Cantharellus anzutake]KAF8341656.1 hypothetical protein EI90DRAFT_1763549 [Cantharellus anzutake]
MSCTSPKGILLSLLVVLISEYCPCQLEEFDSTPNTITFHLLTYGQWSTIRSVLEDIFVWLYSNLCASCIQSRSVETSYVALPQDLSLLHL